MNNPIQKMTFTGPGPLNGKTALVRKVCPGWVGAQFDEIDARLPHTLAPEGRTAPKWHYLGFGWTRFQSKFFR